MYIRINTDDLRSRCKWSRTLYVPRKCCYYGYNFVFSIVQRCSRFPKYTRGTYVREPFKRKSKPKSKLFSLVFPLNWNSVKKNKVNNYLPLAAKGPPDNIRLSCIQMYPECWIWNVSYKFVLIFLKIFVRETLSKQNEEDVFRASLCLTQLCGWISWRDSEKTIGRKQ